MLTALLAIGAAIVFSSLQKIVEEVDDAVAAAEKIDNSVGVLPFVNLDTNPDTGYFSDGVTEENSSQAVLDKGAAHTESNLVFCIS